MKNLTIAIVIVLAMLTAWGCKTQTSENQQPNPDAQEVAADLAAPAPAENAKPDGNQAAPAYDAPKNSDNADKKADPQNAQPPAEISDSELDQILAQAQELPDGYVDIAEWCRPGMTKPISAQEWANANNAFGFKFLRQTKGNTVFSPCGPINP